ncbi:MAG: GIY-YIG nuclease family protein [Bacteroidales bacterium]|nr:GIY-YIG nuclease family protein [Bacteroidales bacterium]
MYYIYILRSISFDKYYVGYTSDISRRIEEHNSSARNTYTSKYRPWKISALFAVSKNEGETIIIERYIKKQKSRSLLMRLIDPNYTPTGKLNKLVRVPQMRD